MRRQRWKGEGGSISLQVVLDVFISHANFRGLVTLTDIVEPPVFTVVLERTHCRCPVVPTDKIRDSEVEREEGGHNK
ncbi:hypothetical protein D3C87_1828280 [compost metagenome]